MRRGNIDWFRRRALEERELAAMARQPRVARAHTELAEKYEAVADAYLTTR